MEVAERAGLSRLVGEKVVVAGEPVPSTGANPAGKVAAVVAGMAAGADSIDDLDVIPAIAASHPCRHLLELRQPTSRRTLCAATTAISSLSIPPGVSTSTRWPPRTSHDTPKSRKSRCSISLP